MPAAAASPAPAMPAPLARAMTAFAAQQPALPLAVAFSGGADSSALLHACAGRWPGQVLALHVHHGLQAAAEDFVRHCRGVCAQLDVPLHVARIVVDARAGRSPQDAARDTRYAALDALAQQTGARTVALAQHADDQVETIVLALSRGAGLPGLAAMPARWQRHGVDFVRPLLTVPAAALRQWLRAGGHPWIEDPTNAKDDYLRNRIRHRVLPALRDVFPAYATTFARSAAHAAQAQQILAEVGQDDMQTCGVPPQIAALQALSPPRQANALRCWLLSAHGQTPTAAQLAELQSQLAACRTRGHQINIRVGHGQVRRVANVLLWQAHPQPADSD